jgi:hypothetical protein
LANEEFLEWSGVQPLLLKRSKADFFIILDCCYAASATELYVGNGDNAIDILFASSIEGTAPLLDGYSLTAKLSAVFSELCNQCFSTWWLHRQLLQYQKSRAIFPDTDQVEEGDELEIGTTPILCHILSEPTRNRDIVIHRSDFPTTQPPVVLIGPPYVDAGTNTDHELYREFLKAEGAIQRAFPAAEYVDVTTKEETQDSSSLRIPIQASTSIKPGQPQYSLTTESLSVVSLLHLDPRPRRSPSRKMGDVTGEEQGRQVAHSPASSCANSYSPETRMWLNRYNKWADVYETRRGSHSREKNPYKMAVLCTGVDKENQFIQRYIYEKRIFQRDFLTDSEDSADTDGSGTNIVYLLATMSRTARLFVAKVATEKHMDERGLGVIAHVRFDGSDGPRLLD